MGITMTVGKNEKAIYDRASGIRTIILLAIMLLSLGIIYQKSVSRADAADLVNASQESVNEEQSAEIQEIKEVVQEVSTQQKLQVQQTKYQNEVLTKAVAENAENIEKLVESQDQLQKENRATLNNILAVLKSKE